MRPDGVRPLPRRDVELLQFGFFRGDPRLQVRQPLLGVRLLGFEELFGLQETFLLVFLFEQGFLVRVVVLVEQRDGLVHQRPGQFVQGIQDVGAWRGERVTFFLVGGTDLDNDDYRGNGPGQRSLDYGRNGPGQR